MDELINILKFALMCYGVIWLFFTLMPHDRPKKVRREPGDLFTREELQNSVVDALEDNIIIPQSLIQK